VTPQVRKYGPVLQTFSICKTIFSTVAQQVLHKNTLPDKDLVKLLVQQEKKPRKKSDISIK